ncbi:MAG TPA: hypothetical protein DHV27_12590 [Psychrobacter sp.]|nr:hypothetical protein [Psychrobacter sp.]HCT73819.1 hypothetical protein [Psychrobacter sp.]
MLLIHEMMLYALAGALCTLHFTKLMVLNPDCDIFLKIRVKKGEKLKISRKKQNKLRKWIYCSAAPIMFHIFMRCH